mgnify:FL=1
MSLTMITDRTGTDAETAALLRLKVQSGQTLTSTENQAYERGICSVTMLNRIENAQKTLAEALISAGYMIRIQNKTWTENDILYRADYNRILQNLDVLKNAFTVYASTPENPGFLYGWKEANEAEKILSDLDSAISDMKQNYKLCGKAKCGGGRL